MKTTTLEQKIIWSYEDYSDEESRNYYQNEMRSDMDDDNFIVTEEMWRKRAYEDLGDERMNLDVRVDGVIIAFGELNLMGLWRGQSNAYKLFGDNVSNILTSQFDDAKWFGEDNDIKGEEHHKYGVNNILYRVVKDIETAEELGEKIYNGEIDKFDFIRQTESLYPYVAKVYGWE